LVNPNQTTERPMSFQLVGRFFFILVLKDRFARLFCKVVLKGRGFSAAP